MDNSDGSEPRTNIQTPTETPPVLPQETDVTTPVVTPSVPNDGNGISTKQNEVTVNEPIVPSRPPSHTARTLVLLIIALIAILGAAVGGYLLGGNKKQPSKLAAVQNPTSELTVPQGATVIAQCAKGRGTQYALPKDIPLGPVYNVYEGKVIGIEYMVGKEDLLGSAKNYLNLPLNNGKYDHVNIGLLSQGHAGFPLPHYHVDIMIVPVSVTDKITCTPTP